jgi:hypothetical protein
MSVLIGLVPTVSTACAPSHETATTGGVGGLVAGFGDQRQLALLVEAGGGWQGNDPSTTAIDNRPNCATSSNIHRKTKAAILWELAAQPRDPF